MKTKRILLGLLAATAVTVPSAAFAATHNASMNGVRSTSNGYSVSVTKTIDDNKGTFAHYTGSNNDRVTAVNSGVNATLITTSTYEITAINACLSNSPFLPSTCSAFNNAD